MWFIHSINTLAYSINIILYRGTSGSVNTTVITTLPKVRSISLSASYGYSVKKAKRPLSCLCSQSIRALFLVSSSVGSVFLNCFACLLLIMDSATLLNTMPAALPAYINYSLYHSGINPIVPEITPTSKKIQTTSLLYYCRLVTLPATSSALYSL